MKASTSYDVHPSNFPAGKAVGVPRQVAMIRHTGATPGSHRAPQLR